jgi:micrococcal nuclease
MDGAEIDVRLLGINAPEADECFYDAATDHLTGLLQAQTVEVEVIGTDQFGRTLAYLWMGGALVNLSLVSDGYAIATTPGEGDTTGNDLISAEDDAFSDRVGLWATDACGASAAIPSVSLDVAGSQFDPPGPDEEVLDREWVTFESEEVVELGGWKARDESSAHRCVLRSGSSVAPGQTLTLTSADPCWEPGGSPVWNNGGDLVLLLDPTGRVVARTRYHD